MAASSITFDGDRLAKVMARAGLCSRRDAEDWIKDGRVSVNGKVIRTPAFNVTEKDQVKVDGQLLTAREGTRVWLYHKPPGLVVTEKDPEGRRTIFEDLTAQGLPRVVSVGRLDINTEGLLLLTNDGGLKRVLELPSTGWLRRYRVRAFGTVTQQQLDQLAEGIEVEGVAYGPIEAELEREQGANVWLTLGLREGKNREVKNVLGALGLTVNRLIRTSFGPFQLGDLPVGAVEVVKARVLREQLGKRLAEEADVDFDSELPEPAAIRRSRRAADPTQRVTAPGKAPRAKRASPASQAKSPFHFTDDGFKRSDDDRDSGGRGAPRRPAPGRDAERPSRFRRDDAPAARPRRVFLEDGTTTEFEEKTYGKKPRPVAGADAPRPGRGGFGDRPRREGGEDRPKRPYGDRPPREGGDDRPKRSFGDRPPRAFGGEDRPKRPYGDRPPRPPREGGDDRPKRSFGDRPPRAFGGEARPKRPYGDRPPRPPREGGDDRPKRSFGDRPPRAFGAEDRPKRLYGDRPPRPPREGGDDRPKRSFGDRPPRAFGAEDRPKRPYGDRPPRPRGDDKPFKSRSGDDKPFRSRSSDDKPKRPRGSGPGGDRPRRPRPPKA